MYRKHLDEKDPFVPLRFMFLLGSVNMCLYTDILKSLLKIIEHNLWLSSKLPLTINSIGSFKIFMTGCH